MTIYVESVYLRGNRYYFQFTDRKGQRKQKGTGTSDKELALKYAQAYVQRLALGFDDSKTLGVMLEKFSKKETNPRYQQALITEESYSELHAERVGYRAVNLRKMLPKKILNRPLSDFTRQEIRDICVIIINKRGRCRSAQQDFQLIKSIFSLAVDDGYIPYSPCNRMANIRYEEEKREAIPAENIAWLINHPEFFPDTTIYDFFVVVATTGMRRGEVLGITKEKLYNGALTVDQQFTVKGKFQPPKKGIIRVIPLANITRSAYCVVERPVRRSEMAGMQSQSARMQ